jgi:hypothetical protein
VPPSHRVARPALNAIPIIWNAAPVAQRSAVEPSPSA